MSERGRLDLPAIRYVPGIGEMAGGKIGEQLEGGRLKGAMFRSRFQWLEANHPEALPELWRRLPPEIAREFRDRVDLEELYAFRWLVVLDRTIADFVGGGMETWVELGRYSASLNLATTLSDFSRGSAHEFLSNQALLNPRFQDFGSVDYFRRGPTSGAMNHRDYPCFSPVFCASALGFYQESVAFHGGRDVRVSEVSCQCRGDATCTFEIVWR